MSVYYGALELKIDYQEHLLRALLMAAILHVSVIGGLLLYNYIKALSERDKNIIVIDDIISLPPPSLQKKPPTLKVELPKIKPPVVGIPKALPDEAVMEEITIASQKELAVINAPLAEDGEVKINVVDISIPNPDSFIDVDEEPVLIRQVKPAYPPLAYQNKIEGQVVVKILVDTDGKVLDTRIDKSSNEIFNEEAIAAVKQWNFKPAILNKKPVRFWYHAPIVFKLE
ncbi:MAG: TonB family protein [candidate division Zixibacteria bacterium]|nr:TonB family protein [candidate division Zixibacteria bacterium]MCI0596658.1 TonB family protein [candidate division Zixibacteria bacterium]